MSLILEELKNELISTNSIYEINSLITTFDYSSVYDKIKTKEVKSISNKIIFSLEKELLDYLYIYYKPSYLSILKDYSDKLSKLISNPKNISYEKNISFNNNSVSDYKNALIKIIDEVISDFKFLESVFKNDFPKIINKKIKKAKKEEVFDCIFNDYLNYNKEALNDYYKEFNKCPVCNKDSVSSEVLFDEKDFIKIKHFPCKHVHKLEYNNKK